MRLFIDANLSLFRRHKVVTAGRLLHLVLAHARKPYVVAAEDLQEPEAVPNATVNSA